MNKYKIYRVLKDGIWFKLKNIGWTQDSSIVTLDNFIEAEDYTSIVEIIDLINPNNLLNTIKSKNIDFEYLNKNSLYHIGNGVLLDINSFIYSILEVNKDLNINKLIISNRLDNIVYTTYKKW